MLEAMAEKDQKSSRGRPRDPESKRSKGGDRHTDPRFALYLEQELLDALDEYRASLPHDPGRSQIVRDSLRDFLRQRGFPKKKKPPEA